MVDTPINNISKLLNGHNLELRPQAEFIIRILKHKLYEDRNDLAAIYFSIIWAILNIGLEEWIHCW